MVARPAGTDVTDGQIDSHLGPPPTYRPTDLQAAGPRLMAHSWHQAGLFEQSDGAGLVSIDHQGIFGFPAHDERHDAVVAHRGQAMRAVGTVNSERSLA